MKQLFLRYGLPAIIALVAFFTGAVTDVGEAVKIAMDKEKSVATYEQLIDPAAQK